MGIMASLWLLMVAYRRILSGLTKSTDRPSRGLKDHIDIRILIDIAGHILQ